MRSPIVVPTLLATAFTAALTAGAQTPSSPTPAVQASPAQTPPAQGPTFRTGVDVISIDVAAVDERGGPVDDLLAAEFAVRVDGKPRKVVSVQQVKFEPEPSTPRRFVPEPEESFFTTNIGPREGRLIVIAVDELNIRPGNVRQLLRTAARFVEMLSPADQVAFYAYPQPGVFVDFTSDHTRVRLAMERVVGTQVPYTGRFNIGMYEATQVILRRDELIQETVYARECGRAAGQARALCEQEILSEMSRMVAKVRADRYASLQGLQDILRRLHLIDGPKALVIVSEGLVLEDTTDLDDTVRMAAAAQASVNVMMMDVQRGTDVTVGVMPPTMTEDREMQVEGLREMAAASRGNLFTIIGDGENAFNRLRSELSAYYILGVEADPQDRDDATHRLDVEVRRRGVTLRSRRAFVLASPRETPPATRLGEMLSSPFGVPDVPLRVTTFAIRDRDASKVRLLIAADVGQAGATADKYTVGWALIDAEGRVAASGAEQRTLIPVDGQPDTPLGFSTPAVVTPGVYSLRLGVVDESGRRGSVVREVNAWKLNGEQLAVADLIVGRVPQPGGSLMPAVEPHVEGTLAAVLELYATNPAEFDRTDVMFEIADGEDGAALVSARGQSAPQSPPNARGVQAVLPAQALPAGRYVVRARITRDGMPAGLLVRPVVVTASAPALGVAPAPLPIPRFDRASVMAPAVLNEILDDIERRTPSLDSATTAARSGQFGAASLEALGAGAQEVAAFFKGLDWLSKGQLDQAAGQLNIAAGPRRGFFPAAFYLGATFAAAGRDRDAAGVWQMAIGAEPRPAIAYALFADARFRDGQPQSVIDVLLPAWNRQPSDDAISQRLAIAFVLTGRHSDAIPVFEAYLSRNPADQDALYAAIVAQYEAATRAGVSLSDAERARVARWARAYSGPQRALVDKYVEVLRVR